MQEAVVLDQAHSGRYLEEFPAVFGRPGRGLGPDGRSRANCHRGRHDCDHPDGIGRCWEESAIDCGALDFLDDREHLGKVE